MPHIRLLSALLLALTLTIGMASSAAAGPRKWPQGRITYVDQTRDPQAVKLAIRAWNRSGIDIRFVKVASARKARLLIRNSKRVPGGCGTGLATLGYPGPGRKGFVNILHGTDADGQGCAVPGQTLVLAHELGHVIGLEHNMSGCSLMNTSHTNGVAPTLCLDGTADAAKPGRWRCRLMEKVDLTRAKRLYGGKVKVQETEYCDAIDRIPATGPSTATAVTGSFFSLTVARAAEPAVPAWLGTWAYGEPGFEVHATPNACTAIPGDDATRVGVGLWGATPVGGSLTENLQPLAAGLTCLSVWQFDQGYNFASLASTVMVTSTGGRMSRSPVDLPTGARVMATPFD